MINVSQLYAFQKDCTHLGSKWLTGLWNGHKSSDTMQDWLLATHWQSHHTCSRVSHLCLSEPGRTDLVSAEIFPAIMVAVEKGFCNSYKGDSTLAAAVNFEQPQNWIAILWWMLTTLLNSSRSRIGIKLVACCKTRCTQDIKSPFQTTTRKKMKGSCKILWSSPMPWGFDALTAEAIMHATGWGGRTLLQHHIVMNKCVIAQVAPEKTVIPLPQQQHTETSAKTVIPLLIIANLAYWNPTGLANK